MAPKSNTKPAGMPVRGPGKLSAARQAEYDHEVAAFVERLLEIRSRSEFSPGARGWCYLLEGDGLITKGQFDQAEYQFGVWRKGGQLPLWLVGEDDRRLADNLESLHSPDPRVYARAYARIAAESWKKYTPVSFWDFQHHYIEHAVEKVDLKSLFGPVCAEFHVPIVNFAGWTDINSRVAMMQRFREHQEAGRKCVLLYCGDLDPGGSQISGFIRSNLMDLEGAAGWSPTEDNLIIDRFGLNLDFVKAHKLTRIDNLETGSGKDLNDPNHPDHFKPYVQDYKKLVGGAWKVEANALVARPQAGRDLCRRAILKYLDLDGIRRYEERLAAVREEVRKALPAALREALRRQFGS